MRENRLYEGWWKWGDQITDDSRRERDDGSLDQHVNSEGAHTTCCLLSLMIFTHLYVIGLFLDCHSPAWREKRSMVLCVPMFSLGST